MVSQELPSDENNLPFGLGFQLKENPSFWKQNNIQVVIRIRPLSETEISQYGYDKCIKQDSCHSLTLVGQPQSPYTFDLVAHEHVTQENMFKAVGIAMVDNCMDGYNSCIFAYGQRGSGKTHTMLGDIENGMQRHNTNCGMIPRVFEYLFDRIQKEKEVRKEEKVEFTCKCSFLQIYNEDIFDLLDSNSTSLQIREDLKKGVHVENLKEHVVSSATEAMQHLISGTGNRKNAATKMNRCSSRSHSIFTCVIESKWEVQGNTRHRFARLNLVDLAASERQESSGAEGERLTEAININKSLSQLGIVITVLVSNKKPVHVPYRGSKLTFLLRDSLGGNSKTCIIANISPSNCCASETQTTLQFAQRAKFIKNDAIVNEKAAGVENKFLQLQPIQNGREIESLKVKLNLALEENQILKRHIEEVSLELEREKTTKQDNEEKLNLALEEKQRHIEEVSLELETEKTAKQELKKLVDTVANASTKQAEAHETVIRLTNRRIEELSRELEREKEAKQELKTLVDAVANATETSNKLTKENGELRLQMHAIGDENEKLKIQLSDIKQENEILINAIKERDYLSRKLEETKREFERVVKARDYLAWELEKTKREFESVVKDRDNLARELEAAKGGAHEEAQGGQIPIHSSGAHEEAQGGHSPIHSSGAHEEAQGGHGPIHSSGAHESYEVAEVANDIITNPRKQLEGLRRGQLRAVLKGNHVKGVRKTME